MGWWDANGVKCLACQNALDKGMIPAYVCSDRSSWYSTYEITNQFKISSSTITLMIREGKLKSRKIKAVSGPTSFEIFLKQENKILENYSGH